MERTLELPAGRSSNRDLDGSLFPVLIEVPALESRTRRSRPSETLRPFPRKRVRRRLKREVRAALAAIFIVAPGVSAGSWFVRNARDSSSHSQVVRHIPTTSQAALATSAAAQTSATEVDTDGRQLHAPAIQPGVVVPVYGPDEDPDHAGS